MRSGKTVQGYNAQAVATAGQIIVAADLTQQANDSDQLELAIVEYVSWFSNDRLHESLGDTPPAEFEALYAVRAEHALAQQR